MTRPQIESLAQQVERENQMGGYFTPTVLDMFCKLMDKMAEFETGMSPDRVRKLMYEASKNKTVGGPTPEPSITRISEPANYPGNPDSSTPAKPETKTRGPYKTKKK